MRAAIGTAWLWLAGAVVSAAEAPSDLGQHTPQFAWRTLPSGEHWIYDGELPVGAFYAGTEPMRRSGHMSDRGGKIGG